MNITSINNNASFKGLWEVSVKKINKTVKEGRKSIPIYQRKAIYHPFSDESEFIIKGNLNGARRARVYKYSSPKGSHAFDHYIINKTSLGEKLDITEKDYEKIRESYPKKDFDIVPFEDYTPKPIREYPKEIMELFSGK